MSIRVSESASEEREGEERESIQMQIHQGIPQIPFDLFVEKSCERIRFTDAFGNLVYVGRHHSFLSLPHPTRALFDSSSNPLISISRSHDGSWKAFKGDGCSEQLLLRVEQTPSTFSEKEFNIFLVREDGEEFAFTMRGCLYWRSCTIYQDKSIVAQEYDDNDNFGEASTCVAFWRDRFSSIRARVRSHGPSKWKYNALIWFIQPQSLLW